MQDNGAKWFFSPVMGGQEDGPNDPVLNHFEGDYEQSIVREIIQNSIDARDSKSEPVRVVFNLKSLKVEEIPDKENLYRSIELSKAYSKKDARYQRFCEIALEDLNKNTIPTLVVGDYNTRGLEGDFDTNKSSLFKLVKSVGANDQTGVGGGSYGIGKGAPFVASKLRTILYSSRNIHNEYIFTGSARLSTFEQTKDNRVRGVGFFETVKNIYDNNENLINKKTSPLRDSNIAQTFKRQNNGTDIIILDYKIPKTNTWDINLVAPILNNFWVAIYEKDLIVELVENDKLKRLISSDTIEGIINDFSRKQTYNDECKDVYKYFDTYKNPDNKKTKVNIEKLGACRLYVKLDDEGLNQIDAMRAPKMSIEHLTLRSPERYTAVFICDNTEGNSILRSMEPPNHKHWNYRLSNIPGCSTIVSTIKNFVKATVKILTPEEENAATDIPGLSEYFPEDDEGFYKKSHGDTSTNTQTNNETAVETPNSSFTQMNSIQPKQAAPSSYLDVTATGGGQTPTSEGANNKSNQGETSHNGPDEDGDGYRLINNKIVKYKYVKPNNRLPDLFKIKLCSSEDQDCSFKIVTIADDGSETSTIKSAINHYGEDILTPHNRIHIKLKANIPEIIEVAILDGQYKKIIKVAA